MDISEVTRENVSNRGERVLPDEEKRLLRAHQDRYRFAWRFLKRDSTVLDCASGTGYGSALLSHRCQEVQGVDVSPEAVQFSSERYHRPGLHFSQGEADRLVFPDGYFDVICSFETIEHVENPDAVLRELRRVLKDEGVLLLSTPNRVLSGLGPGEKPENPFHLFEWSLAELDEHLKRHFSEVIYFAQRVRSPNKVHPKYVASKTKRALRMVDLTFFAINSETLIQMEGISPWAPENFLAVCRL